MTTSPGWEPRPGPTRGKPARPAPRGDAGGWPGDDPNGTREGGPASADRRGREGYGPRRQGGRGIPPGERSQDDGQRPRGGQGWDERDEPPRTPRFTEARPPRTRDGGRSGAGDGYPARPRPRGGPDPADRDRSGGARPTAGGPAGRPAAGPAGPEIPHSGSPLRQAAVMFARGAAMSTRNASLVLVAGSLLGVVLTLITGSEPGGLLAFFIIVSSLAATLSVRARAIHVFFPVPTLAFLAAAVVTGAVHDSTLESSTAGLSAAVLQWIGAIFVPAFVATILVVVIGGARWVLARQLLGGEFARPGRFAATRSRRPAAGPRRPAASAPWAARGRPGAPRTDRDPWGDPRPPADRPQSQPPAGPRPRPDARPTAGPEAGPAQPPAPRSQSRAAWEPRSQRPGRDQRDPGGPRGPRDPRDPWD